VEQPLAEVLLEGSDLLGQRRLGDTHPLGGLREMAGFGHRDEVTELLKLHPTMIDSLYGYHLFHLFDL
jgi:hypothetical protein